MTLAAPTDISAETTNREIERKFIVINEQWKKHGVVITKHTEDIVQGYVTADSGALRLHIDEGRKKAWLILKTKNKSQTDDVDKEDSKFGIPFADALEMKSSIADAASMQPKRFNHIDCTNRDAADTKPTSDVEKVFDIRLEEDATVRFRLSTNRKTGNKTGMFTLKSARTIKNAAIDRDEWNYPLPAKITGQLLDDNCAYKIEKTRYHVQHENKDWSVDEFHDLKYQGLVLAEVEFKPGESTALEKLPNFVHEKSEVTEDKRFTSKRLANPEHENFLLKELKGVIDGVKTAIAALTK